MAKRKTKSDAAKKSAPPVPFETALQQLQEVVSQLEDGNLSLSESLEKYEQGVANLKRCYLALDEVQKKIELLVDLDSDGNLKTRPFDDAATAQPVRKTTRQSELSDQKTADSADELANEDEGFDIEQVDDPNRLF